MLDKNLRKYIIPNILSMLGISCYVLADTFFISIAEGADGITALNLTLPLYSLIFALGALIGVGSATRYSIYKASGRKEADEFFSNAVLWSFLISLVFVIGGVFFPAQILTLMGGDAEIVEVGRRYLCIALSCAPFFMMNYSFTSFVRNDEAPKLAMAATLCSNAFNIVFDYVFMFPMHMGMPGAALASGMAPAVSMLICLFHYLSKNNHITFRFQIPSPKRLLESCSLGFVAFIGEMASGVTTMAFNFILLSLGGNIVVAAYGIIANVAIVGMAILNGVSQGLQPLASLAHGKSDVKEKKKIYLQSRNLGVGLSLVMVIVIWIFSKYIVGIFNSEQSMVMAAHAETGIKIYFIGYIFSAINMVKAGFLSAIGKGAESSVIAFFRGVIAIIAFAFLLSRIFGVTGVWMAFPAAEAFTMILSAILLRDIWK